MFACFNGAVGIDGTRWNPSQPDQGLNRAETAMLGAALAAAPEVPKEF